MLATNPSAVDALKCRAYPYKARCVPGLSCIFLYSQQPKTLYQSSPT